MANYNGIARTNYFGVTDSEKFYDLIGELYSDSEIIVWKKNTEGKIKFGFGSCSDISYIDKNREFCMADFMFRLGQLLPDGEAAILTEAGHEKLNYIGCGSYIVTNRKQVYLDLQKLAVKKAAEMLDIGDFVTEMEY